MWVSLPPNRNDASRAARGGRRQRQACCPPIVSPLALIGFWMATNADHPAGPVHAAFIYNAPLFCGDLARTQSLPDQVHQNQGVALWQQRRRRVRRRNRRAREVRLEHREILIRQAAGREFGRFRLCCSKSKQNTMCLSGLNDPDECNQCKETNRGKAASVHGLFDQMEALRRFSWRRAPRLRHSIACAAGPLSDGAVEQIEYGRGEKFFNT